MYIHIDSKIHCKKINTGLVVDLRIHLNVMSEQENYYK